MFTHYCGSLYSLGERGFWPGQKRAEFKKLNQNQSPMVSLRTIDSADCTDFVLFATSFGLCQLISFSTAEEGGIKSVICCKRNSIIKDEGVTQRTGQQVEVEEAVI